MHTLLEVLTGLAIAIPCGALYAWINYRITRLDHLAAAEHRRRANKWRLAAKKYDEAGKKSFADAMAYREKALQELREEHARYLAHVERMYGMAGKKDVPPSSSRN